MKQPETVSESKTMLPRLLELGNQIDVASAGIVPPVEG